MAARAARGRGRAVVRAHLVLAILAWAAAVPCGAVSAQTTDGETTVYLTPEKAVRLVLPGCDEPIAGRTWTLSEADRSALERRTGRRLAESAFTIHTGTQKGQTYAHAVITSEVGKFKPFDFIVAVSPEGRVLDIAVLVYREGRGGEVAHKRFNRQLVGKTVEDPIRINRDILNITGATMSVRAICAGVKKVLAVVDHFVLHPPPPPPDGEAERRAAEKPSRVLAPSRSISTPAGSGPFTRARTAMGTLLTITVDGLPAAAAQAAVERAFGEVERLEAAMSLWRADSELVRAVPRARREPVPLSADLFGALALARRVAEESDGAFDPTVGPLVRLWGFIGEGTRVPAAEAITAARARVGWRRLLLDPSLRSLRLEGEGSEIDLGGIGKGWAVDRAVAVLRAAGATAGMVNFSGNLRVFGPPPPGLEAPAGGWTVHVQHPRDPESTLATLRLAGGAVSSSGDYEKFFLQDGVRYGHILDPRTGWPARGLAAVTVVAPTAAEADALSTALFVLGVERGRALLARHYPGAGAIFAPLDATGELAGVERAGVLTETGR
ncbi:MAG: FAD:protein FMN transferase [Planctomycetes bacterium]|nr:FAD:protein FMN transferase [Planctomycetota bacterium]